MNRINVKCSAQKGSVRAGACNRYEVSVSLPGWIISHLHFGRTNFLSCHGPNGFHEFREMKETQLQIEARKYSPQIYTMRNLAK
jgi:hypothetical protein